MPVAKFLDAFVFAPNIEVVESLLPDMFRGVLEQTALSGIPLSSLACQHAAREADLERLHHGGRILLLRFADEQVNMLRHHHVAGQHERIPLAHLLEHGQKKIATSGRPQKRLSAKTTAGDELQVS